VHISRSLTALGLAAALLAAAPAVSAAAPGPGAHPARPPAAATAPRTVRPQNPPTSADWAGAQATGSDGQYTSVSAQWVQPWVICSSGADEATWVGLDGSSTYGSGAEQAGTEAECSGTSTSYYAFYQLPLYGLVSIRSVLPDDEMYASVSSGAPGHVNITVEDITQNWTYTASPVAVTSPAFASAEAIVSAGPNSTGTLAEYGFQGFSNLTVNGDANPVAAGAQALDLSNSGSINEYASPVTTTGGFSVSYGIDEVTGKPLISFQTSAPQNQLVDDWSELGQMFLGQTILRNTSPSLALLPDGGFEEAIMTAYKTLVVVGTDFTFNTGLPVAGGSSPVIAANSSGLFEVVFEHSDGVLWTYTISNHGQPATVPPRSMVGSSTPTIVALSGGGFEIAYTANTGTLDLLGPAGDPTSGSVLVRGGTNPGLAALTTGGVEAVFEDSSGDLVEGTGSGFSAPTGFTMAGATNPVATAVPGGGFEIAYINTSLQLCDISSANPGTSSNSTQVVLTNTAPGIAYTSNGLLIVYENDNGYLVTWYLNTTPVPQDYADMAGTSTYPAIAD
jgi:hypothetical protein